MKKQYQTPTTLVVTLQHIGMLMTSGTDATRNGYGTANKDDGTEQDWE
jgi:hypothetical protein